MTRSVPGAVLAAPLLLALAAAGPAGAAELPYVVEARRGEAASGKPELHVMPSAKLELVMLAAALADREQTINRPRPDNPLGAFWSGRTKAFGFSEAARHLRDLRPYGLWGDRLLDLALVVSDPPALERVLPWPEPLLAAARAESQEDPAAVLTALLGELRAFAAEVRFGELWKEKRQDYERMRQVMAEQAEKRDPLASNAGFWGVRPGGDVYILPSALVNGGYLARVAAAGREHDVLAIGPVVPEGLDEGLMDHLLYHELSHPLVDPVLDAHSAGLEGSVELWGAISSPMTRAGVTTSWQEAVSEHLLRAYNIMRLRPRDPVLADLFITSEAQAGYIYTRRFLEMLDEYAAGRDRWPGLPDYMPRLVEHLDGMAETPREFDPARRAPDFDIVNADFEAESSAWLVKGWNLITAGDLPGQGERALSRVARAPGAGREGSAALRLEVDSGTSTLLALEQGPLAVRAGGTVRLEGWVKTENVRREGLQQKVCGLYILFTDRQGQILSRGETDSAVGTLDWTPLSAEFVAPAGTARASVGILLGMSGTAWFDDLALERAD